MGYLKDMYGSQTKDFRDGVKAGIEMYAHYKDGKQSVGVLDKPLEKALKEVDDELTEGI